MGFMDKAKQMADQAQQKIEETQKQFNDGQAQRSAQQGGAPGVRYDSNGRPIAETAPPAAQTPAAPVTTDQPLSAQPAGQTQPADPGPAGPEAEQPAVQEQPVEPVPVKDGVNSAPDPFKPIQ